MRNSSLITLTLLLLTTLAWAQEAEGPILSGKVQSFSDPANHLAVKVPAEYKLPEPGAPVLTFTGPNYRGGGLSLHINTVPMPSLSSEDLFKMNWDQKKNDPFYTDLNEVNVPGGKGFSFKEVNTERNGEPKTEGAIHRWHLLAFGQGRFYNCVLGGSYGCFQDTVVTDAFQGIIRSFSLSE